MRGLFSKGLDLHQSLIVTVLSERLCTSGAFISLAPVRTRVPSCLCAELSSDGICAVSNTSCKGGHFCPSIFHSRTEIKP